MAIGFTCKKNIFFTGYAQRKFYLWKSCGFDFVRPGAPGFGLNCTTGLLSHDDCDVATVVVEFNPPKAGRWEDQFFGFEFEVIVLQ